MLEQFIEKADQETLDALKALEKLNRHVTIEGHLIRAQAEVLKTVERLFYASKEQREEVILDLIKQQSGIMIYKFLLEENDKT